MFCEKTVFVLQIAEKLYLYFVLNAVLMNLGGYNCMHQHVFKMDKSKKTCKYSSWFDQGVMKDQVAQKGTLEFHTPVEKSFKNPPTHYSVHLPAISMYVTTDNLHAHEKL